LSDKWIQQIRTLIYAAIGAALFWVADFPLPFLFGPMTACLLAALLGQSLQKLGPVSAGARTILGVAVGTSITPAVVAQVPAMAASVALVPVFILAIGITGVPYFHRVMKFDKVTAYYAAMPGGLQDMIIFGGEAGGDVRALSLIHATRVLFIVTLAPVLVTALFDASLIGPIGAPASELPVSEMILMVAAALIGWKGAERLNLFGATILGPMIVAMVFSLAGFIHNRPPAEAILAAQFFIGLGIGVNYVGITLREIRRFVFSGVIYVLLLAVLATIFAWIVTLLGLAPPLEGFLAFAPGGQAEMTVLTIILGADLGFVIVHHLTRLILVIFGAPIAARFMGSEPGSKPQD
jgi:membrane AbrB-like protein